MDIVENFQFVLQLQILEFPEAPKNHVQLSPNTTRKRKQFWMCAY